MKRKKAICKLIGEKKNPKIIDSLKMKFVNMHVIINNGHLFPNHFT